MFNFRRLSNWRKIFNGENFQIYGITRVTAHHISTHKYSYAQVEDDNTVLSLFITSLLHHITSLCIILISQCLQVHIVGQEVVDGEPTVYVSVKGELKVVQIIGAP